MNILLEIFKYVTKIFPVIVIINPNEKGVLIRFGRYIRTLDRGWRIYWPVITEIQTVVVVTQVIDLPIQSLLTKDGKILAISGALEYTINDVKKALLDVQDFDKSLPTLAMGIISQYVKKKTLTQCKDFDALKRETLRGLRRRAKDWGISADRFYITDLTTHKAYRLLSKDQMVLFEE